MKGRCSSHREIAMSAFETLNDLMGEIHAGRIVGLLASKNPSMFKTKHSQYFVRIGIGAIMIALYKFEDLWDHQIRKLLADELLPRWKNLSAELKQKKIRQFRSLFVAHYSDCRGSPKPPLSKLEALLKAQGFNTDEELFLWTKSIIEVLQEIRDRLSLRFDLT
ncbi:hypothetical protein KKG63_00860 [Patescibacteria group bacterium]|nr:hypothetical protein [Patescibacteria group bacterium]